MTEDDRRNEITAQIEQIKLGCTVWVPRLPPEEIGEYTRREKPIKLNKIGERHYEINDSSDSEPMTISLSDTESDDPPSIPSAAHEKVAENITVDDAVTVECDSRERNTENVDSNISFDEAHKTPANFYLEGVPTDESQNAVESISEASTVISVSSAAAETQSNVPVNFTVSTDKSQNSVIVTVSEASPVIPVPSVAATAANAPVTTEDALATVVNVPAAAPHSPANNEIGVIRRNLTFKKNPITPAVTKGGVIMPFSKSANNKLPPNLKKLTGKTGLIVYAIRQVGNHASSLTGADAVNETLESILFPKSSNNQQDNLSMPSLDNNNVIAKDPITSMSRSSTTLPSLPAKDAVPVASRSPTTLVSLLAKDTVSITQRSPTALPSLPANDAVPVTSRSPTTLQSLLARDDISITQRPPILSPSLPANNAIPISSPLSTSLPSLTIKDAVSTSSQLPISLSSSASKYDLPISPRVPVISSSLPTKDAAPFTKIRVKSTQDLGVKDPGSGTNFLNRDDISITQRPSILSPSLPTNDAVPISSPLSTSLPSLTTKNAVSTSSQLPISLSSSASKYDLPISPPVPVISSSLPTKDAAPFTKIRVKSTQDLGVKDLGSGTNFLNTKAVTSTGDDGYPSKQSVNSNFRPTMKNTKINKAGTLTMITLEEFNNYVTSIAYSFKLQFSARKQYESKHKQLLKRYSSASSVQHSNDGDIELQVLRSNHEAAIRNMNKQIISKLNECVGYKQFDGIMYEIFMKFFQQTKKMWPNMKKMEFVENLSQMWIDAISSDVYSVSNLANVIPRDRFFSVVKEVKEIFLNFDKTTPGRKRAFPTQSQVPPQQSSQELPVKVPRQNTTAMSPVYESATENRNLMRPLQPPVGEPAIENRNSMWPPVSNSSPRVSSLSQKAKNAIPTFPLASDSMSELIKHFFTEPSLNSSSHAVQNRLDDSLSRENVVNVDHAYSNVVNEMLNDVTARDKIATTANQPKSNPAMNARSQCHLYEKSPPPYSKPVVTNQNCYTNRGEMIRQTSGGAVNRAPGSGQLPSAMYPRTSVSSNVAPFQLTTTHSSARLSSPNYSSISPRQTPPAYSPCSSRCNSPTCRQISCHSPFNYPPSISPPYFNYPPQYNTAMASQAYANQYATLHQFPYRYPSPGSVLPNVNLFHQNPTWNDHQIRGRNFNESVRNHMPYMNNSVIRQNVNSTAVTAIPMKQQAISQQNYRSSTQYVSPIQRDHAYIALPEIESSQNSIFRPQQIGLPPFSSFVSNENLVVRVADSSLSPSAGPSPNPMSNNEMPLSVPIVQSTSSPSVDQLYELEGLESIGQPLKDSEIQELLLSDLKKNKNEF